MKEKGKLNPSSAELELSLKANNYRKNYNLNEFKLAKIL